MVEPTEQTERTRLIWQPSLPRFSIVLPCYNEEDAIQQMISELHDQLGSAGLYEIVVVDDGSTDKTDALLQETAGAIPNVRVVTHARNRGYGAALKTGIREASTEMIVILDADGTYPIRNILEMLEFSDSYDMVVGARELPWRTYPFLRRIPKLFFRAYCSWLAKQPIPDINSGLRVFRRDVVMRFFRILPNGFSFTTTITLAMLTNHFRVRYFPISYAPRIGQSKIRPIRDTLNFVQLITRTGIYFAPLRVLMPIVTCFMFLLLTSITYDIFRGNLTDKTVMMLMLTMNTLLFGLLADMINKLWGSIGHSSSDAAQSRDDSVSPRHRKVEDVGSNYRRAA